MNPYRPTNEETDALFKVAPYLHDAISINNNYFHDDDTDDEQRKIIFESSKTMYKSCLKIYKSNQLLPFA